MTGGDDKYLWIVELYGDPDAYYTGEKPDPYTYWYMSWCTEESIHETYKLDDVAAYTRLSDEPISHQTYKDLGYDLEFLQGYGIVFGAPVIEWEDMDVAVQYIKQHGY